MWGGDAFIPMHWSYTKLACYFAVLSRCISPTSTQTVLWLEPPLDHVSLFLASETQEHCVWYFLPDSCHLLHSLGAAPRTAGRFPTKGCFATGEGWVLRNMEDRMGEWWGEEDPPRRRQSKHTSTCSRLDSRSPAQHDWGSTGSPIINTVTWKSLNRSFTLVKFYLFPLKTGSSKTQPLNQLVK